MEVMSMPEMEYQGRIDHRLIEQAMIDNQIVPCSYHIRESPMNGMLAKDLEVTTDHLEVMGHLAMAHHLRKERQKLG